MLYTRSSIVSQAYYTHARHWTHTRKYSESVKCTTHARAHWIPQPHVKTFSFVDVVVLQTKSKALTNERTWIRFGHCCKYKLFLAVRLAVRILVLSENVLVDDFGFDRVFCICFLYFIVFLWAFVNFQGRQWQGLKIRIFWNACLYIKKELPKRGSRVFLGRRVQKM